MMDIVFPDGRSESFPKGTTGEEIAASISPGLKKQALAIKLDGVLFDLRRELTSGGSIEIVTYKNKEGIDIMRHSTAHLMAKPLSAYTKMLSSESALSLKKGSTMISIWNIR